MLTARPWRETPGQRAPVALPADPAAILRAVERRAKIVATLGPATREEGVMRSLLAAGVDVVRLNLSHGTHEEHRAALRLVRRLAGEAGRWRRWST